MLKLLDPLKDDALFISAMFGSIRLYALNPSPWASNVKVLVREILRQNGSLRSWVAAARTLLVTGGFSNRIHLRRRLGVEAGPSRGGRKRRPAE